ncbi:hypothetical protein BH09ACT8_BH09ACT8_61460 [soil metagenome]
MRSLMSQRTSVEITTRPMLPLGEVNVMWSSTVAVAVAVAVAVGTRLSRRTRRPGPGGQPPFIARE